MYNGEELYNDNQNNIETKNNEKISLETDENGYVYQNKTSKYDGNVTELYNKKGENLGYVSTSTEDDVISIDYMHSNYIEHGVSDKIVKKLIDNNPDKTIRWDCVSEESEGARRSFVRKHPELENKIHGLWFDEVQKQYAKDENIAQNTDNSYNALQDKGNAENDTDKIGKSVLPKNRRNEAINSREGEALNGADIGDSGSGSVLSGNNTVNERGKAAASDNVRLKGVQQSDTANAGNAGDGISKQQGVQTTLEQIAPNIVKKAQAKKKKYTAPKERPQGTSNSDRHGTAWYLNPQDKKARFYSTTAENDIICLMSEQAGSYDELISKLQYSPTERNIVEWYRETGMPYEEFASGLYPYGGLKGRKSDNINTNVKTDADAGQTLKQPRNEYGAGQGDNRAERPVNTKEDLTNKYYEQNKNAGLTDEVAKESAELVSNLIEITARKLNMTIFDADKTFGMNIQSMTVDEAKAQWKKDSKLNGYAQDNVSNNDINKGIENARGFTYERSDLSGDTENLVVLLKGKADISTIAHETGHVYLNALSKAAKEGNKEAKKITDTINKWLKSDGNYTYEQHEKFAESFVEYIRTNKAPNSALREVFRKFKEWLNALYQNIKSKFKLSKEAKEVFDEILGENKKTSFEKKYPNLTAKANAKRQAKGEKAIKRADTEGSQVPDNGSYSSTANNKEDFKSGSLNANNIKIQWDKKEKSNWYGYVDGKYKKSKSRYYPQRIGNTDFDIRVSNHNMAFKGSGQWSDDSYTVFEFNGVKVKINNDFVQGYDFDVDVVLDKVSDLNKIKTPLTKYIKETLAKTWEEAARKHPNLYYQSKYAPKTIKKAQEVKNALQKIADGSEEETVADLRNDLEQYGGTNDVTFIFGDDKKGIQHIAQRHGVKTLLGVFDAVIDGNISKFVKGNKTVHIEKNGIEAVLSLDENGNKKTWLLTGWNSKISPDEEGQVCANPNPTQTKPTFSRQDLGAELNNIITDNGENLNGGKGNSNPEIRFQKDDDAIGLSSFRKNAGDIEGENFGIRDVINNIKQKFDDYKSFKRAIDEGRTVKELCETEGIFKLFEDDLKDFGDYVVTAMPENMAKQRTYGRHYGKQKAIMLNMEAIGNDVNRFTEVLMHEFEHAKQKAEFDRLEKKGNLTHKELQKVVNYKRNTEINKKRQAYYNKNEKVLAPIIDELGKLSTKAEKDFFINGLNHEEKRIYNEYRELYDDYRNSPNEISAREAGTRAAERVKNVKTRMDASRRELVEIRQERDVRTRPRSSIGEYEEAQRRRSEAERSGEFEASEEPIGLSGLNRVEKVKKEWNKKGTEKREQRKEKSDEDFDVDDIYDVNDIAEKVKKPNDGFVKYVKKNLTPVTTRLDEISPVLKFRFALSSKILLSQV